jgi:hypothetical protein
MKYLAKFQSPRAITLPKFIGPEQNVNLICNLSVYTHIPNIKSISQSIVKKKWSELFYFGITDMGNTIHVCPSHLVAGDIKNPDAFFLDRNKYFPVVKCSYKDTNHKHKIN